MLQESSKRSASTSPPGDSARDAKHLRFATDLWSDDEHLQQDETIKQCLIGKGGEPREYPVDDTIAMAMILELAGKVATQGPHSHLLYVSSKFNDYLNALDEGPDLLKLVGEAYRSGSYKHIRCHEFLRKKPAPKISHCFRSTYQEKAVEQSWEREFSGDAAQALWKHVTEHYNRKDSQTYAHSTAIVQSSGMGKSRTVDELGKCHFVIPINLRGPHSTGYPPADNEVRDFLTANESQADVYNRNCAFLEALFDYTAATLQNGFGDVDDGDIPLRFRTRMTEGQSYQGHNPFRVKFYHYVIRNATKKFYAAQAGDDCITPARACERLVTFLRGARQSSPTPSQIKSRSDPGTRYEEAWEDAKDDGPLIILAFDEAHMLTTQETTPSTQWSNFSELEHALRVLHHFSCFSLFMSTTGKISQITEEYNLLRILSGKLILIQPFTDMGFDTLARKISLGGDWDLRLVTTTSYMAHQGRPLFGSLYDAGDKAVREDMITFAAAKLLNADPRRGKELRDDQRLACLSQRIPLEFNSTTSIDRANERKQVEAHMRVCLKIDALFESMATVSASEPLLSEAAYSIMAQTSFCVPKAMKSILDGFSINKGDHGEILIMLFFTVARDKAVGPPARYGSPAGSRIVDTAPFLAEKLFNSPFELETLHADFPNGKMHFNHYVKVHEYEVIDAESLLLLSSRGAGILCANNQHAIDGINPFLCNGPRLCPSNLGLILWQAKNDTVFTATPEPMLFAAMDVYELKILKEGDTAVPLIKIVFALAARTPSLTVVRHPPSKEYDAVIYEIWCAGISPDILAAVEPSEANIWAALLRASYGWKSIYGGPSVDEDLRRSMIPGAAKDIGHWQHWAERSDGEM